MKVFLLVFFGISISAQKWSENSGDDYDCVASKRWDLWIQKGNFCSASFLQVGGFNPEKM